MVRLDRIYTRSGDLGQTSLGDGSRVSKTSQRILTMGVVDELNCQLGVAAALSQNDDLTALLAQIQQLLFDLGADLCCPVPDDSSRDQCPRIADYHVTWMEQQIDTATDRLQPLCSFILPGGAADAACLHLSRAICRRAELEFLVLAAESAGINSQVGILLNRLSDLLFVLARCANNDGQNDVLWNPGRAISKES